MAADDVHHYIGDEIKSYLMVNAEELSREAILEALCYGRFYVFQGTRFVWVELNDKKKKSFTISKGTKVYFSSLAYKSGKLAIKVTAGGKSGCISAAKSYSSTYPFKELLYAG